MSPRAQQLIDLAESLLLRYGRSIEFLTIVEVGENLTLGEAHLVHNYILSTEEDGDYEDDYDEFDCE